MTTPRVTVPPHALEAIAFNLCSLHDFDVAFVRENERFATAVITEYVRTLSAAPAPEGGAVSKAVESLKFVANMERDTDRMASVMVANWIIQDLATRDEAPDWTARTEAAWAENNSEEAPAEAGELEAVAKALAKIKGHRDVNAMIWLNEPQIEKPAWEFYLDDAGVVLSALRAQPQAREDAQPVSCQSCGGEVQGWVCQGCGLTFCERDGRLIAEHPAPDARRVAVEKLETAKITDDPAEVFMLAMEALAALQAERGAK